MSTKDLYSTCKNKAIDHKMYYHYTNIEALLKILSSKSIRLTQLALANDLEEENRIDLMNQNKVFVACFSHDSEESIPLWNIYSKDKYGVRLGLPDISFFQSCDNYYFIDNNEKKQLSENNWAIKDASIVDIEYVDEPYEHINYMDPLDTGAMISYPVNIGIIKRKSWSYEYETRARVYINLMESTLKYLMQLENKDISYPFFDYIYCKIDDEYLNQMNITFNPLMSSEMKELIKLGVGAYLPDFNNKNFYGSILENKIRM